MKFSIHFFHCLLFLTLIFCAGHSYAQCGYQPNATSGCVDQYTLELQDTTHGAGNTANWSVILPNNDTLHCYNSFQCVQNMTVAGIVHIIMTDTINGQPCAASGTVTVNPNPIIKGAFNTNVACVGSCVQWIDSSIIGAGCTPYLYFHIFWGDGDSCSYASCSCKTYTANNTFSPGIVIVNSCGCIADTTFQHLITVTAPPPASFSGSPLSSCTSPLVSTMTAASGGAHTKYIWYVSTTGTFSNTPNQANGSNVFTYSYPAGTWNVKLVVVDTLSGCTDSVVRTAYVTAGANQAACFTASDTAGCAPLAITYTPCTSGATEYIWSFPGAGINPTSATNPGPTAVQVSYQFGGYYSPQLIVIYGNGCRDTLTRTNYIHLGTRPVATFTTPDSSACTLPANICLTYTGSPCAGCTFQWGPPSLTTSTSDTGTCFNITAYGQYSPTLTVSDSGCQTELIKTNYINVTPLQACSQVTYKHGTACANDTIVITNCSVGGPFTVTWSLPGAHVISSNATQAVVTYPGTGCNDYTMTVHTASGCTATFTDSVCIGTRASIDSISLFPHDLCFESVCNEFVVAFAPGDTATSVTIWPEGVYTSGGPVVSVSGPDTFKTCYTYPDFGNFAFCYAAKNFGCVGDTVCLTAPSDSVHIYPPSAKFSYVVPCNNSTNAIQLTNLSTGQDSSVWTFQGAHYPDQNSLTVVFPQCGVKYPVSLTAFNRTVNPPLGCNLTVADTFDIPCFGADFKFSKTTGCYLDYSTAAYLFLNNPATDLVPIGGATTIWSEQLSPGGPVFAPGSYNGDTVADLVVYGPGVYNVCVKVSYPGGCIDTLCKPSYVDISRPEASFTASDTVGCIPFCTTFTNTSVVLYGAQKSFYWTFGDAAGAADTSYSATPTHCFTTVGQFQVCLNITDTNGCTSNYCKTVQANSIVANFAESDSTTCTLNPSPLNPITYTDSSTGFVSHHYWILPAALGPVPASQPDTPTITEQYTSQGYGQICMVAVDQFGVCRDTVCKPIHVINPIANYTLNPLGDTLNPCPPVTIQFLDTSQNDICTYSWNFNNGNSSVIKDPVELYTLPGTYPVVETVTSCHGCAADTLIYNITIKGPEISAIDNTSGGCPCLPVTFYISSIDADSIQFNSNNGQIVGGAPFQSFVYFGVPRGTPTNPTIDTISVLYCKVGVYRPSTYSYDLTTGCKVPDDSLVEPIVVDTPISNFSYSLAVCGTYNICFVNETTYGTTYGHDSTRLWSFGDGATDTSYSPCHNYAGPGLYTVTLRTVSQHGCINATTQQIYIPVPPVAAFTVSDTLGCIPFLVHFTDSSTVDDSTTIVSGHWNFGNGTVYNTADDTSYTYTAAGTYTATLIITDGYGCSDTASRQIQAKAPPTFAVGPNPTICLGDTATLSVTSASPILWLSSYNIDNPNSSAPRVWPGFDTTYIVQIGSICYVYDTVSVYVSTITITQDTATNLCLNEQTIFTAAAQATHATITGYSWSFGDGNSATGNPATHRYAAFGAYNDVLIVTNSIGCKDTASGTANISDIPHAALGLSADTVCLGVPVTATNLSTPGNGATLSAFLFEFQPAGLPAYTASPYTFTLPLAGTYNIFLIQTNSSQCVDTAQAVIMVHSLPVANFNNDTSCISIVNQYTSSSIPGDGPIDQYQWSISGALQPADSSTISYTFATAGTDTICLAVTDVYGCTADTCKPVPVFANPMISVNPADTTICAGYSASFVVSGSRFSSVQWVPSVWVSNPTSDSVTITPGQTVRYQVYGYYLQCVPAIDTVDIYVIDSVPVSANADPDNVVLGLSSNVTSTVKGTIDSIVWGPDSTLSCRNCMNPIAVPSQTTTYTATIYYSKNGVVCSNQASVTITVYQSCGNSLIYVPNTFTPNGDGNNDVFRIRGQGIAKVNYFRIYDRWGKKVFETDNADDTDIAAWNGGLNNDTGKPENSGVFVYVFEVQCITGQTITGKGNVTLLR
jgi:gliding motility-associated-like protein